MRRAALLVLVVLAALTAGPPGDAQGSLRLRDLGPYPSIAADGPHLLGLGDDNEAVLFDVRTGRHRRIAPPAAGCQPMGLGAGALLLTCLPGDDPDVVAAGIALDLASGAVRPLPSVRRSQLGSASQDLSASATYAAIGRRWARLSVRGYHYRFDAYVDRVTGAVRRGAGDDRRATVDLDRRRLVRPLCSPLRRPLVEDESPGVTPGSLATAGPWGAAVTYPAEGDPAEAGGRVVLQHCGRRPLVLDHCPGFSCFEVALDDRTVAWVKPRGWESRESRDDGAVLRVRDLRTGRTRARELRFPGHLLLARHRLFLSARGRLFEVRLPYAAARAPK